MDSRWLASNRQRAKSALKIWQPDQSIAVQPPSYEVYTAFVDLCLPNLASTALNTIRSSSLKRNSIIIKT